MDRHQRHNDGGDARGQLRRRDMALSVVVCSAALERVMAHPNKHQQKNEQCEPKKKNYCVTPCSDHRRFSPLRSSILLLKDVCAMSLH